MNLRFKYLLYITVFIGIFSAHPSLLAQKTLTSSIDSSYEFKTSDGNFYDDYLPYYCCVEGKPAIPPMEGQPCDLSCYCGDGRKESWEACDPGKTCPNGNLCNSDEDCSSITGSCLVRDTKECRTNCSIPRCGDGIIDSQLGEQCDGNDKNCEAQLGCDSTCQCNEPSPSPTPVPSPSPSPTPSPVPPPPSPSPNPGNSTPPPDPGVTPGTSFLEGSGILSCSLHTSSTETQKSGVFLASLVLIILGLSLGRRWVEKNR